MVLQCAEDEKLERRRDGRALKARELVVHERMAQGGKVTGAKVKNIVKRWSTEEMKDQTNTGCCGEFDIVVRI